MNTKLLNKHRRIFKKDIDLVEQRRSEWGSFSERAQNYFNKILSEFKKDPFFDELYLNNNEFPLEDRRNQNTIGLSFGKHATGISIKRFNIDGSLISAESDVEDGGALIYSQAPNGQVLCLIYSSKSDYVKSKDKFIIYKRYKNPKGISEGKIKKAVSAFFWYARTTSYSTNFKIRDTIKLDFINPTTIVNVL